MTMKKPFGLLRYHIFNLSFLRFEVIGNLLHSISLSTLTHLWFALKHSSCILLSSGENCLLLYVVGHICSLHLKIVVLNSHISKIVNHSLTFGEVLNDRILRTAKRRRSERPLDF
ncbi:hypothetical protein SDC9_109457 [bioreactor metagenome]|uniref:Uncharacterized protein n=1 Tax=bioreactor metagenome TaxID=1076179 RepID=A0A645BB86_9ZZZZ